MTLRERNLTAKITRLSALAQPTAAEARELVEAKTALGYATGATPIATPARHAAAPIRGNSYTAMIDAAGDINNLLRANGNAACAE